MTSAFSWQNSVSLCPASFCTPRPTLPVTPGISSLPTFAFQSPIMIYWASLVAQLVKDPPAMLETFVQSLVGKIPWRRERLPTLVFWPREFHGLYSAWGYKESVMTE